MASKTHVKLSGSKRGRDLTAIRVGKIDATETVVVTIGLVGPKLPNPDEFVGQTMTPKELAEKFGAKKEDAKKVAKYLTEHGLDVKDVSLITRSMCVSGTAKAMEAVFKPEWAIMRSPTQAEYRSRQGTIHIPWELREIVTGVFGLDQRRMARPRLGTAVSAGYGAAPSPLTPKKIEKRYNFPPGDGDGQSIAIAQFGGGYLEEDVITYCNNFGRPAPDVHLISVDGAPVYILEDILDLPDPTPRKNQLEESFEVTTDVEIIAGLCPKASISVYFSTFDERGWVDLLDRVITAETTPVALSISWGFAEDDDHQWSWNGIQAINDRLNLTRLLGITTCVASGDDGCRGEVNDGRAHVDFPSSSPYVLSVGGTMLEQSGSIVQEVTWWDDPGYREGATGGGVSTVFPRPLWQNVQVASINPTMFDGRVVPDVSALAGEPYYVLFFLGLPWPNGKTSASAPVWAALIARINARLPLRKRQRFLTPLLYRELPSGMTVGEASFRDITKGCNACYYPGAGYQGYEAGPGFDAATGWGVPNGVELLRCLRVI